MGKKDTLRELQFDRLFGEDESSDKIELAFGNDLSFVPFQVRDTESTGGSIYKDGKLIGETNLNPISSCEDGGFFLMYADKAKKTYRYCDENGRLIKRVFGKDSSPFFDGFARAEIIDETVDNSQVPKRGYTYSLYTFARKGKNGEFQLMKHRFALATFMDKCGLARVVLPGEKYFAFVTKKGYILPYRFLKAEDCFRDGMAPVKFPNGVSGYLRDNFDIVQIRSNGTIKVVMTLKNYIKQQNQNDAVETARADDEGGLSNL